MSVTPFMKRSNTVTVGALATLSAMVMAGCTGEDVTADCVVQSVNGDKVIVNDDYCGNGQSSGGHGAYYYVYGGNSSGGKSIGGTTVRPADTNISTRTGTVISRGGFGGRGSSGS